MSTEASSFLRPEFRRIADLLTGVPWTLPSLGWVLYEFVKRSGAREIVELGSCFGVGTCYLAGGVAAGPGRGRVMTYDRGSARSKTPNLISLLERTGLQEFVSYRFDDRGYNWLLGEVIHERHQAGGSPIEFVDFCFIDGAHSWDVDGLAFFLIDKLLKPGGWILFDDLMWTFANPVVADASRKRFMTESEQMTPQVGRVFDLLVEPHPAYDIAERWHNWGWARKRPADSGSEPGLTEWQQVRALLAEAERNDELAQLDAEAMELRAQRQQRPEKRERYRSGGAVTSWNSSE